MYVLYPDHCLDGFGAAFAAHLSLGEVARYLPVDGGPPPVLPAGADVWLVGFSYRRDVLTALGGRHPLTVIDHHESARPHLERLRGVRVTFDPTRSAAVLTHRNFFAGEPVPDLLRYIQDGVLQRWELDRSVEVEAALSSLPREFPAWRQQLDQPIELLADRGAALLRTRSWPVNRAASPLPRSIRAAHA